MGLRHCGPVTLVKRGNLYIIVASEYKSLFCVARPVPVANRSEFVKFLLDEIVLRFGAPRVLITDRGSLYMSEMLKNWNDLMRIKHVLTTACTPWADGITESCSKDFINKI